LNSNAGSKQASAREPLRVERDRLYALAQSEIVEKRFQTSPFPNPADVGNSGLKRQPITPEAFDQGRSLGRFLDQGNVKSVLAKMTQRSFRRRQPDDNKIVSHAKFPEFTCTLRR